MTSPLLTLFVFVLSSACALGQATRPADAPATPARGRGGPGVEASVVRGVLSPEVSADHRITFRLRAPNAKKVQVQGDFTIHMAALLDMTKDDNGIWSCTTEPLKPS